MGSYRIYLIIAFFAAVAYMVGMGIGGAKVPLLLSFFLAYLTFPVIATLEKKGLNRNYSVTIVFTIFTIFTLIALALVVPKLVGEAKEFVHELPKTSQAVLGKVEAVTQKFGFDLALDKDEIFDQLKSQTKSMSLSMFSPAGSMIKAGLSNSLKIMLGILNLFLFPVFFFYVVSDYEKIMSRFVAIIPPKIRERVLSFEKRSNLILSGYIRGQLLVASILAASYGILLSLVGLKFGFLIGLLAGAMSIVPYAGFTIGFAISILVALANFQGYGQIVGVVAVFTVVQLFEGFLITPKLVGDKVGLSPFATMLALIIGGNLFGYVGILLAIPGAAILKMTLADLREQYLDSKLYRTS